MKPKYATKIIKKPSPTALLDQGSAWRAANCSWKPAAPARQHGTHDALEAKAIELPWPMAPWNFAPSLVLWRAAQEFHATRLQMIDAAWTQSLCSDHAGFIAANQSPPF